jgi:aryl-alcohol dehydrogenase-like predicted oxidoreductase
MEYRRLGQSGLKVSRIGLGCMSYGDPTTTNAHTWALDDEDAQPFFRQAVEMGVTFWDTANTYQEGTSEEVVCEWVLGGMDFGTGPTIGMQICRGSRMLHRENDGSVDR